jgi:hypothetical protein
MTVDVAVRLGLQGGQAATRGVEDFGRKGGSALAQMRKEAAALPPHLVAVSRGVGLVKDGVDDMAARAGSIGKVAEAFGPMALYATAAGAALAAGAVAFYHFTEAAIAAGDAIADAATNAGVSTDTLQEMRYAVHAVGGEYEDADQAIGDFTKRLGAAESGNKKALIGFKQLGFTQADLKSFASADEALRAVMDRVSKLGKESERQYISEKLGLGPMIPLLREGTARMDELRQAAHEANYVMGSELVAAAGDANDKIEDLDKAIGVQLNSSLIEAAPLVVDLKEAMLDGAKGARGFATDLMNVRSLVDEWAASHPTIVITFKRVWEGLEAVDGFFQGISKKALEGMGFDKAALDRLYSKQKPVDWSSMVSPDRTFNAEPSPSATLGDYGADGAASAAASKQKAAAAAAKKETERLTSVAEKAAKGIAERWEGATKAVNDYTDATALSAAKLGENKSEIDQLERIKAYYADINDLLKAGVDILQAKALVQARILAEAKAEAHARANPEDFVSSADRLSKALGGATIGQPGYDFTWLREGAGQAFYEGLMDADEGGDFFDTFERRLREAAMSALANKLTDAIFGAPQTGGGSGGGWIDTAYQAVSNYFSAGRATGGPTYGNDVRPINEHGIEGLMKTSGDAFVVDAARTAREMTDAGAQAHSTYGGAGGQQDRPIDVSLHNNTGTPMRASASETRGPDGSRSLKVLMEAVDQRADARFRDSFSGRDDTMFGARFGIRPRLSGG